MLDFLHVCVQSSRLPLLSTTVGRKNTSDLNEFQKNSRYVPGFFIQQFYQQTCF